MKGPANIPVFLALLKRHDLTRFDVLLYGAVAYMQARGEQPTTRALCDLVTASRVYVQLRITHMTDAGLMRIDRRARCGRGHYTSGERYITLLGPALASVVAPPDDGCQKVEHQSST